MRRIRNALNASEVTRRENRPRAGSFFDTKMSAQCNPQDDPLTLGNLTTVLPTEHTHLCHKLALFPGIQGPIADDALMFLLRSIDVILKERL